MSIKLTLRNFFSENQQFLNNWYHWQIIYFSPNKSSLLNSVGLKQSQRDRNLEKDPYVDDRCRRETRKFGVRIIVIYFIHTYMYKCNSYINYVIYIII